MPYNIVTGDGQTVSVPVRIKPAEDHKLVYAHGAQGGALANYHYRIDFYQDIFPPIEYNEADGRPQIESIKNEGIERRIVASIYLPLPFAKELAKWLEKNLQHFEAQYGEIRLPGEEIEEANIGGDK